jgi:hypothetical protein
MSSHGRTRLRRRADRDYIKAGSAAAVTVTRTRDQPGRSGQCRLVRLRAADRAAARDRRSVDSSSLPRADRAHQASVIGTSHHDGDAHLAHRPDLKQLRDEAVGID